MAGYTLDDRVYETTTTTGTGTVNLAGAQTGYQTFVAGIGSGNSCTYCISDQGGANWEVGIGTVTSGSPATLSRTNPPLASSNAGALVNFGAGTKDVVCTRSAANMLAPSKSVYINQGTTTYTPTTGAVALLVECLAAGGAGGGAATAASSAAGGGGGGSGAYSIKFIAGPLKSSYTVSVGAGGTAGTAGNNPGNAGGDTSFDSPAVCYAVGGGGGSGCPSGTAQGYVGGGVPGDGGSASAAGDVKLNGGAGGVACRLSGTVAISGAGTASVVGGETAPRVSAGAGVNGSKYGGGGSGGLVLNGSAAVAGGTGADGLIIVTEYIA